MLERSKIRHYLVELLKDKIEVEIDGENYVVEIYDTKVTNWDQVGKPVISISITSQNGNGESINIPIFSTSLSINFDIVFLCEENWADKLDEICEKIENLILKNPEFIKEFSKISDYSTNIKFEDGAEKIVASARITLTGNFDLEYQPIILDDYLKTNLKIPVNLKEPIEVKFNFNNN